MQAAARITLRNLSVTSLRPLGRSLTTKSTPSPEASSSSITPDTKSADVSTNASASVTKTKASSQEVVHLSSCAENTIMPGLNYLKNQPPVQARPDSEYPPWLWKLLQPKVYPNDGPGGKGEKMMRRKQNKQWIKEQNFLKTQ